MTADKINDRQRRHAEFVRLFSLLPGPSRADRAKQCTAAMRLVDVKHVRKYMMTRPARVPTWQGLQLLAQAVGEGVCA
jgi:hypothetical protein